MGDNEIYIRTIAAEITNRNDYSQDGIQKTSKKGENVLRKIGLKIKEDHNLTEKTNEITHKLVLKVYGITVLICLFYFLLPQNVCSQTYLKKKLNFNKFTTDDSLTLSRTLKNAKKWYMFKSKKCISTIGFLESFLKYYSIKEKKIDSIFIGITCGFNFNEKSYKNNNGIKTDSSLFFEKIRTSDFFKDSIFGLIDKQRFEIAKNSKNKKLYFRYLEVCDFFTNEELKFKKAAEDSIFNIYTPHLYVKAKHYLKLNELISYLEYPRNERSSNYSKALECLYLIYTNDGELSTIEKLKKNSRFVECMKKCPIDKQKIIDSLVQNDIKQAKIYERILSGESFSEDSTAYFIRKNLPKESAYIVLQKFIKKHILLEEFIEATEDINFFLNEDDKKYELFPEMKYKIKATIGLLDDSKNNKVNRHELGISKAKIGYGPIRKVFLTKSSYYFAIDGNGYNNMATITKNDNTSKNTILTKYKVSDVSYDDRKMCVLKDTSFLRITTNGKEKIQDYFSLSAKKGLRITSKDIQLKKGLLDELTIVNDSIDYYLSSLEIQYIQNKYWLQLSNSKKPLTDIVKLVKGLIEPLGGKLNGRYVEKDPYMLNDTIYFSSNSFYGFGGFDIFMSTKKEENDWTEPQNLGFGVNSPYDDVCFRKVNNQNVFICDNKGSNLPRIALTTDTINSKKRSFFLSVDIPDEGNATKEIHVKYFDKKGNEIEQHASFIEGNKLNIKLDTKLGSEYLIISYMNENTIGEKQINLDSITFPDINMKDTIIFLPNDKKGLSINEINPSILSPKIFNKYVNAKIIKEHPQNFYLGNNLLKWHIVFSDSHNDNFTVERNIKLEYKNSDHDDNFQEIGEVKVIIDHKKPEIETKIKKGETKIHTVYFETDKSSITKYGETGRLVEYTVDFLNSVYEHEAKYGKNNGKISFEFSYDGYADFRGASSYNMELSRKRSQCVRKYLNRKKYREEIIRSIKHNLPRGHGETNIYGKDKATIEERWQENRRVNVTIKWN